MKEKVPEFNSSLKTVAIITIALLIFLGIIIFFWWFDRLVWYGFLISQSILTVISSLLIYGFTTKAEQYREKYGVIAYRYFFFHFVALALITANAGIFHTLLVEGPIIFPFWFAILVGTVFIFIRLFLEWHLRKAGFDEIGHGFGIYNVFPEEGERINSDIYSFIRHPMYLGDICLAFGFALLKNNIFAIFTAIIALIPFILAGRFEDEELVRRFGEEHKQYIKKTGAIFPHLEDTGKFLRFLFTKKKESS